MTFDYNILLHVLLFILLAICAIISAVPRNSTVPEAVVSLSTLCPPPGCLFDISAEVIDALAEDIRANGMLQPLLVRPYYFGCYQIIDGTKRFYAARKAGLKQLQVRIANVGEIKAAEYRLVNNIHAEETENND